MNNVTTYSYPPDDLSDIVRYDSRTGTCAKGDRPQLHGAFGRRLMSSTLRLSLQ